MNTLNFFQRKNLLKSLSLILIYSLSIACQNQNSESSEAKIEAPEMDIATAVISGNLAAVKQHIAAGTDLNQKDAFTGSTPLITAATFDKREIAQALIDGGTDLSLQNNDGSSALHSAAFFGRVEIVQMLIDAKADKNLRNTYGATPREIVLADFEALKPVYQMMQEQLSPMGLQLDMVALEKARPVPFRRPGQSPDETDRMEGSVFRRERRRREPGKIAQFDREPVPGRLLRAFPQDDRLRFRESRPVTSPAAMIAVDLFFPDDFFQQTVILPGEFPEGPGLFFAVDPLRLRVVMVDPFQEEAVAPAGRASRQRPPLDQRHVAPRLRQVPGDGHADEASADDRDRAGLLPFQGAARGRWFFQPGGGHVLRVRPGRGKVNRGLDQESSL